MIALNTVFLEDALLLEISRSQPAPIHLLHVASGREAGGAHASRVMLKVADGVKATLIESFVGLTTNATWTQVVSQWHVGVAARLDHYKIEHEGALPAAVHPRRLRRTCRVDTSPVREPRVHLWSGQPGRRSAARFAIELTLNGLTLLAGQQHCDNHTVIKHEKPGSASHEVFKGIYDDTARGVFSGKIIAAPDAQKTNAYQSNKTLLLSTGASIDTRPQLEIFADDVKCSHGATVGQLDEEAMFYLQARGIGERQARHMLIEAFALEVIDGVEVVALQAELADRLLGKLHAKGE